MRLSSFGAIDRQAGLPFSTTAAPPGSPTSPPPSRKMSDSAIQVILPFKDNKELFGDYVNIYGGVRFGKVMEDLDVFAATCAYMHCGTSSASAAGDKLTIVTAAVDRIDVQMRLDEPVNMKMKGMVTWVGTSSMEVTIRVESTEESVDGESGVLIDQSAAESSVSASKWKLAAIAKFIMVARDGQGPFKVPRLQVENEREREIVKFGEERSKIRLARAQQSLFREPPTAAESIELHRLFMSNSVASAASSTASSASSTAAVVVDDGKNEKLTLISTSSTTLSCTKICHPQERNIHDYIFGGFLMREALELGFVCGQLAAKSKLDFLAVDELAFKHPVPIGAVLQLNAQVVYSTGDLIHVEVIADVICVQSGDRKTTNTFHFTYRLAEEGRKLVIKPATYVEAMKYLEGKRRIESASESKNYSELYQF